MQFTAYSLLQMTQALLMLVNEWKIACDYAAFRNQLVHEHSVHENDFRLTHEGLNGYLSGNRQ